VSGKSQLREINKTNAVGMLHMSCYCGADLIYVGDSADGQSPETTIELLKYKLGKGAFGFFSSLNGESGECPFCGLLYELPEPAMVDWLPFVDKSRFDSFAAELRGKHSSKNGFHGKGKPPHRILL